MIEDCSLRPPSDEAAEVACDGSEVVEAFVDGIGDAKLGVEDVDADDNVLALPSYSDDTFSEDELPAEAGSLRAAKNAADVLIVGLVIFERSNRFSCRIPIEKAFFGMLYRRNSARYSLVSVRPQPRTS